MPSSNKEFSLSINGTSGQALAVSGTAVQSAVIGAALTPGVLVDVIVCAMDVGCYLLSGANPTATNTCAPLSPGSIIRTSVPAGHRISVLGFAAGTVVVFPEL